MTKGNSNRNDNAFSVQHGLCGSYDFVLIPTSEGLFYGLTAICRTAGGSLEEANNLLLDSAVSAVRAGTSPKELNGVLAYRIVIGLADNEEMAVATGLSVDDFVSHPNAMVRQTIAISSRSKETNARLLADPELSVQYMTAVGSEWNEFSEAQTEIAGEVVTEVLLNPDCSERAADLAMASYSWPPTLIAAAFTWDIVSDRNREKWVDNETLWETIAKSGKMEVWSCETVQSATATYRNDWREWFDVFGGMYHNISDAFSDFLSSRSVIVYNVGG